MYISLKTYVVSICSHTAATGSEVRVIVCAVKYVGNDVTSAYRTEIAAHKSPLCPPSAEMNSEK